MQRRRNWTDSDTLKLWRYSHSPNYFRWKCEARRIMQKSFFDVRLTHPNWPSHVNKPQKHSWNKTKQLKRPNMCMWNANFTPLVLSTNGATCEEATYFHKVLAKKLSEKTKSSYAEAITSIWRRSSFTISRTALNPWRGKRRIVLRTTPIKKCDINILAKHPLK